MSPKRWILLLLFYISYLMFGASIYYHLEHGLERQRRANELKQRIEINAYLIERLANKNETDQEEILERISDYCGKPVTDYHSDEYEVPYTWTFYHSFFFAFTVCSTVGYGNISPTTTLGQMIVIAYSIIGIPVNGILFAGLGEYFGLIFQSIYHRYKKYKMSTNIHYVPPKLSLITTVLIALIPGITMFLLLPSWVFSYFENWPFSLALYYAYVTTTTIGFGDYVPTFQPNQHREFGAWFVVYQIFIIVWFIFSLGYLLMIMTFITRGLQSKKLAHLEQQLSMNIKATQHRIWSGVTKDVSYIRRIFNELYLMKYKPIYSESITARCGRRSISCPNLTTFSSSEQFKEKRKRAASECFDAFARAEGTPFSFNSISDTEMNKIDRQKSFETAEAFRQTTSLLFKVVDALAAVKPPPLDDTSYLYGADVLDVTANNISSGAGGHHGFSDSQILASERWSVNNDFPFSYYPRNRASSDFNVELKRQNLYKYQTDDFNEWTWSGDNNQIQEAINNRCKQRIKRTFNPRLSILQSVINMENNGQKQPMNEDEMLKVQKTSRKSLIPESLTKWIPFKKKRLFSIQDHDVREDDMKFSAITCSEHVHLPSSSLSTIPHCSAITSAGDVERQPSTIQVSSNQTSLTNLNDNISTDGRRYDNQQQQQQPEDKSTLTNSLGPLYLKNSLINKNSRIKNSIMNIKDCEGYHKNNTISSQYQRNCIFNMGGGVGEKMLSSSRRPSILSFASQNDADILETTTIADLIRALETMHTQAVMGVKSNIDPNDSKERDYEYDKLKREKNVSFKRSLPLPLLFGTIDSENEKTVAHNTPNRLHERRSTIGSNMAPHFAATSLTNTETTTNNNTSNISNITNLLTKRRRCTTIHSLEPPSNLNINDITYKASYNANSSSLRNQNNDNLISSSVNNGFNTSFKRRFSVRPTNLQIPLGNTPVIFSTQQQQNSDNKQTILIPPSLQSAPPAPTTMNPPQNFLQRRFSLRPSPLAQSDHVNNNNSVSATLTTPTTRNARFLPPHMLRSISGSSTSTHSPLSRIVQISQAHRKSSMPDNLATGNRTNTTE